MESLAGKRLDGRYEIIRQIGIGGMANVYRAKDLATNTTVAVKILRDEFSDSEDFIRRFKNESKAVSLLNHPNIIKVLDVNVTEKIQYIVMELIDGITLKEYIDQRKVLSWKETVKFTTQLLEALAHAHQKGIVHRDIKPQNIMLLSDGNIKVMDFGIARFSRNERRTVTDKAIGSVHYISPEQAQGDKTDARSDIYSVGVMMYEMLAGVLPFESDTPVGVAIKQISESPKAPTEVNNDIPKPLEEILLHAMLKTPSARYQTAEEMLKDIEKFKKNPTAAFEYKYMQESEPTKYIDKVETKELAKAKTKKLKLNFNFKGLSLKDPNLKMYGTAAATFAFSALIVIFVMFKMSDNPLLSSEKDVAVPNFVGMTQEEIEENVNNGTYRFRFEFVEEYSATVPAGQVISQKPAFPKSVKENQRITIRISLGEEIIRIPSLDGLTRSEAERRLTSLGFTNISIEPVENTSVPENTVLRTEPATGTNIPSSEKIVIYIAVVQRIVDVPVPYVVGLDIEEARRVLMDNRLTVGAISRVESDAPPGTVILQTPDEGTRISMNSRVDLTVSIGRPTPPEKTITVVVYFDPNLIVGSTWSSSTGEGFTYTNPAGEGWAFNVTVTGDADIAINGASGPYNIHIDYNAGTATPLQITTPVAPPPVSSVPPPVSSVPPPVSSSDPSSSSS